MAALIGFLVSVLAVGMQKIRFSCYEKLGCTPPPLINFYSECLLILNLKRKYKLVNVQNNF